jgi:hypothetical protein
LTIQHTTEFSATSEETIQKIATELAASERKYEIFKAVYSGGNKPKPAAVLASLTHLDEKVVLDLATPMANQQYFEKLKHESRVAYKKYHHINAVKQKILRLAKNPVQLKKHVSSRTPRQTVLVKVDSRKRTEISVREIFIDDIEEFQDVLDLKPAKLPALIPARLPEKIFKYGVASVLGNKGKFQDWGGEKNDLYSTHVTIGGRRISTAFAFKGPATAPPLTIAKLGKNGDQISRLFSTTAEAFFVQFEGAIEEAVKEDMLAHAIKKSHETGKEIFYGLIALEDSHRLRVRYASHFTEDSIPKDEAQTPTAQPVEVAAAVPTPPAATSVEEVSNTAAPTSPTT